MVGGDEKTKDVQESVLKRGGKVRSGVLGPNQRLDPGRGEPTVGKTRKYHYVKL